MARALLCAINLFSQILNLARLSFKLMYLYGFYEIFHQPCAIRCSEHRAIQWSCIHLILSASPQDLYELIPISLLFIWQNCETIALKVCILDSAWYSRCNSRSTGRICMLHFLSLMERWIRSLMAQDSLKSDLIW